MTNYEHYKNEIENFSVRVWGMEEGIIKPCGKIHCEDCAFGGAGNCRSAQFEWMSEQYQDHEIDWSKVPIDTKILVSDDGIEWLNRYFAGIHPKNKKPRAWVDGRTSWMVKKDEIFSYTKSWNCAKLAEEGDQ